MPQLGKQTRGGGQRCFFFLRLRFRFVPTSPVTSAPPCVWAYSRMARRAWVCGRIKKRYAAARKKGNGEGSLLGPTAKVNVINNRDTVRTTAKTFVFWLSGEGNRPGA